MDQPASSRWRARVAAYQRACTAKGRAADGGLALEGLRLVERALRAGLTVTCAIVSAGARSQPSDWLTRVLEQLAAASVPVVDAPDDVVAGLVGGRTFGELLAVAQPPPPLVLPLRDAAHPTCVLAACDVLDPGNIGALARTALAFGASGMIVVRGADPFHPKALRTAMGALFRLPVCRVPSLPRVPGLVRVGLTTDGDRVLGALPTRRSAMVVVGGEAFGLGPADAAALDEVVTIPMAPGVDSLSVNAAAAVALAWLTGSLRNL